MRLIREFAILLVTFAMFACSSSTEPEQLNCNTAFSANDFPAASVSFQNDILPIFTNYGCNSIFCHGGNPPASNYSVLTAVNALGPGDEAMELGNCNVIRGNPDDSYLIKKLINGQGILGEQMPFGGQPMDAADLQKLRQWIIEGAPDN